MGTPLGGVSDGRGILSLLTGFAKGYQGAKQMQYQRQQAEQAAQDAQANKTTQLAIEQQRADAYGLGVKNTGAYHTETLADKQDKAFQDTVNRNSNWLGLKIITPEAYNKNVSAAASNYGKKADEYLLPINQPASGGMPADPNAPPAFKFSGAGTDAKIDNLNGRTAHTATVDVGGILKLLGPMAHASQAPYLKGIESVNPQVTLPIPGETVVGQSRAPQLGPVAPGQSLPDIMSPIFADYYTPDMKTQADIDAKNAAAQLSGTRATYIAGPQTVNTQANTKFTNGAKTDEANAITKFTGGAKTAQAQASADLARTRAAMLPAEVQSLIDERTGTLDLKRWQAQNGRPPNLMDIMKLQASMLKPGASSFQQTGPKDASGNPTFVMVPGISGAEANPALAQQLEQMRKQLAGEDGSGAPFPVRPPAPAPVSVPGTGGWRVAPLPAVGANGSPYNLPKFSPATGQPAQSQAAQPAIGAARTIARPGGGHLIIRRTK